MPVARAARPLLLSFVLVVLFPRGAFAPSPLQTALLSTDAGFNQRRFFSWLQDNGAYVNERRSERESESESESERARAREERCSKINLGMTVCIGTLFPPSLLIQRCSPPPTVSLSTSQTLGEAANQRPADAVGGQEHGGVGGHNQGRARPVCTYILHCVITKGGAYFLFTTDRFFFQHRRTHSS